MPFIFGLVVIAGYLIKMNVLTLPRGVRNNNPLNIRENQYSDSDWIGERITDDDKSFEEFTKPEYGIRAAARILNTYQRRDVVTLADIIATWAPPTENNTESYINSVSRKTGFDSWQVLGRDQWPDLLAAMIHHENGIQPYSMETIRAGVNMA